MAQKISQMTEQTTASMTETGTSDFLGGYTTTGGNANRKFSLSGLANYFLNKFKMTLGGSSQTVKSAIDALNSNIKAMPDTDNGRLMYRSDTHADSLVNNIVLTRTGCPENDFFYIKTMAYTKKQDGTVHTGHQIALGYNNDDRIYTRRCESGTWLPWVKVPTRAEIDSINSKAFPTKSTIDCNTAYANAASGLSFLFANNSSTNVPIASSQLILNFKDSDNYGTQLSITNSSIHKIYMRTIAAGTWSSWDAVTFS